MHWQLLTFCGNLILCVIYFNIVDVMKTKSFSKNQQTTITIYANFLICPFFNYSHRYCPWMKDQSFRVLAQSWTKWRCDDSFQWLKEKKEKIFFFQTRNLWTSGPNYILCQFIWVNLIHFNFWGNLYKTQWWFIQYKNTYTASLCSTEEGEGQT